MTVLRWATGALGTLLAITLLAHFIVRVIDPLIPLLIVLIFMLAVIAIAIRGR
jgi:hypothetical protein